MDGIISNVGQVQNSKQMSYMMDIKNVGMGILFSQTTAEVYTETFEKYIDYIEQPSQYLKTLKTVAQKIDEGSCTPDDLLIAMAKHALQIQYEDETPEYEEYKIIDEDDDDCFDEETVVIVGAKHAEALENILEQLYGFK